MQSSISHQNTKLGKIFIGGLGNDTTQGKTSLILESLRAYFECFGPLCDCVIMIDKSTSTNYLT